MVIGFLRQLELIFMLINSQNQIVINVNQFRISIYFFIILICKLNITFIFFFFLNLIFKIIQCLFLVEEEPCASLLGQINSDSQCLIKSIKYVCLLEFKLGRRSCFWLLRCWSRLLSIHFLFWLCLLFTAFGSKASNLLQTHELRLTDYTAKHIKYCFYYI